MSEITWIENHKASAVLPKMHISTNGRYWLLEFNRGAMELLGHPQHVMLGVNKDQRFLVVRPAAQGPRAFKTICCHGTNGFLSWRVSATSFVRWIIKEFDLPPKQTFLLRKENGEFVADVPKATEAAGD
jgi:hypothetical protein